MIKIDFYDKLDVSQSVYGQDQISVTIKKNTILIDDKNKTLNRFDETKITNIRPLVASQDDIEMIENNLSKAQIIVMFLQANILILNILLSKSLQDLWGMVNTQKITIHMMLFRCSYTVPSNMFIFNSLMSQLTQKDMYPSDVIFDSIFSFTSKPSPIEHFENLGYEGANFVMLSGSLLINICISVVLSIVLHIVDYICTKLYHLKVARYIGSKIVKTNVLGAIITLYLQSFLEMLLCCFISIKEMGHQDFIRTKFMINMRFIDFSSIAERTKVIPLRQYSQLHLYLSMLFS